MKPHSCLTLLLVILPFTAALNSQGARLTWPQFRGPGGSGVAAAQQPPAHFGLQSNLLWRVVLPPGASSPCLGDGRIFVTGYAQGKLETICIGRKDGQILWRHAATADTIERFHPQEGSPAAATPVTDGERVYVYFGSCGMLCYDFDGVEKWRHLWPTADSIGGFGTGASPVLADGLLILNRDQLGGSQLLALDAATGKQVWATDRGQSIGWCTPAIWEHDGDKEIVLPASTVLKSYDLRTGTERWSVRGIAAATCSTPVAHGNLLLASSWSPSDRNSAPPPFDAVLQKSDKNGDGALSLAETEGTDLRQMFQTFDLNRDQLITRAEYDQIRSVTLQSKNVLSAVRAGGKGDITDSHVAWSQTKGLPYVSSPLCYQDRVYLVKDGGMASCFEVSTGKPLYLQERLGAAGAFYASPVAADGRIYAASAQGVVVVFEAGDQLNVLARNDLGERISATPAIADNTLYVRTATQLFAFGNATSQTDLKSGTAADETLLFDGKTLTGWKDSGFTGSGTIRAEDGKLMLGLGFMTGITWTNDLPRIDYELSLDAMRVDGSDFFCGLTFPVAQNSCTLIVGGWGGNVVGLSSLDYADAANNETTRFLQFRNGRWYHIRVRVQKGSIEAWIDGEQMANVKTAGRKISIRSECEPSLPMGIATWSTAAALRNIQLRRL